MADLKHISATKLSIYQSCPFKYYLNYIAKERPPISPQLAFGKEVHYMLEMLYKRKYKSRESYVNSFKWRWRMQCSGKWVRDDVEIVEHEYVLSNGDKIIVELGSHIEWHLKKPHFEYFSMKRLGERILGEFWDNHHEDPNKPVAVEKRFRFTWRGYPLLGVIDRIDKTTDGRNLIIDYKTDKHPPEGKAHVLNNSPQFTIYSLAFNELYEGPLDEILHYHLRTGELYRTERTEANYEYLEQACADLTDGVENDKFTPNYGYNCNFCDYKDACSKYQYGKEGPVKISEEPLTNVVDKFDWEEVTA